MSKRVASLSGAALRLEALREEGRAELVDLLESLPGTKCLVLESHIGGLLNHVIAEGSKASTYRRILAVRVAFGRLRTRVEFEHQSRSKEVQQTWATIDVALFGHFFLFFLNDWASGIFRQPFAHFLSPHLLILSTISFPYIQTTPGML